MQGERSWGLWREKGQRFAELYREANIVMWATPIKRLSTSQSNTEGIIVDQSSLKYRCLLSE